MGAQTARGQETIVTTTLRTQTPFTTLDESVVTISLLAENLGEVTLNELSVALSIGPAVTSRVGYGSSLVDGPGSTLIYLDTFSQRGSLDPGVTREFSVSVDLRDIDGVSDIDSSVYPARIDLRVAGIPVAWIDTPLVHLVRPPDVPIDLSWWVELDAPVAMDPQGLLADAAFEAAIAPGGGLGQQVEALRTAVAPDDGRVEVDLVDRAGGDRPARAHGRRIRAGGGRPRARGPAPRNRRRCAAREVAHSW